MSTQNLRASPTKISNKPIIWSLFAAGGTVTALLTPVLVALFALVVPMGLLPEDLFSYARIHTMLESPLIRLIMFVVISLSLWHTAHRMRITVHDFGLRADGIAIFLFYGIAAVAMFFLAWVLLLF